MAKKKANDVSMQSMVMEVYCMSGNMLCTFHPSLCKPSETN